MRKVLIANRGEIAVRIARACRDVGIRSAAVFSEADRHALHTRIADEAHYIGPSPAAASYLNIDRLLAAAKTAGADAIHPGYGFLSENAAFARACTDAGLTFIGPTADAIAAMGDKRAARKRMQAAGVPVVPGTPGIETSEEALRLGREVGFPLLVKAAAGGGGRGIRHVDRIEDLEDAIRNASAEAATAFGDPAVYLERYLSPARHIEVQIIGDNYGRYAALSERECSIQRRHQKLVEEAPSCAVTPELRKAMCEAALAAARAVGYRSLGTIEFLVDKDSKFYFLEMNTRVQVEHPITELVTGRDLIADQLRIANGEPLPYEGSIEPRGWAIECRINAEDPYNNGLPSLGRVSSVREPAGPGVRVDSSLFDGWDIPEHYDSMVAKLITWGSDRDQAIARMRRALDEYVVVGVATNIPFHRQIMDDPDFLAGKLDTTFLDRFHFRDATDEADETLAMLAALAHQFQESETPTLRPGGERTGSSWRSLGRPGGNGGRGWRSASS